MKRKVARGSRRRATNDDRWVVYGSVAGGCPVDVVVVDKDRTVMGAANEAVRWLHEPSVESEILRISSFCQSPRLLFMVRLKHQTDSAFPGIGKKGIVGVESGGRDVWELDLRVKSGASLSRLGWILWHELRHWEQKINPILRSVVWGDDRIKLFEVLCDGRRFDPCAPDFNAALHTFHEIDPPELDANVYACMRTKTKYRPNAWSINSKTLRWFREQKRLVRV
jgi:hypothetical protein